MHVQLMEFVIQILPALTAPVIRPGLEAIVLSRIFALVLLNVMPVVTVSLLEPTPKNVSVWQGGPVPTVQLALVHLIVLKDMDIAIQLVSTFPFVAVTPVGKELPVQIKWHQAVALTTALDMAPAVVEPVPALMAGKDRTVLLPMFALVSFNVPTMALAKLPLMAPRSVSANLDGREPTVLLDFVNLHVTKEVV